MRYCKGRGFRASFTPGWGDNYGWGCIIDGSDNPLTAGITVEVEPATKNNVKRLTQFNTNLEAAKDAIVWLFDERKWDELKRLVKDVAVCGYTYSIEERMKELRRYQNSDSTETTNQNNTTMATVEMNNETKNVQNAQVNNSKSEAIVSQVDVIGLMNGLKKNGTAKLSDYATPVEDAHAEEVESVNVGEVTVDSIMPVMQPVEGSELAEEKPAVTVPLGDHDTLVVGGVPKPKKSEDKPKTPQTSSLPRVTLVVYTTKRGEQAPRIEGFGGENDPRWKHHYDDKVRLAKEKKVADAFNEKLQAQMKGKPKAEREKLRKQWKSVGSDPFGASYFTDRTTGDKYYQMTMGAKYMEVAQQLVDAYNSGDAQAIAAAEQSVIDCKNGILKNIDDQKAAKRAEREAKKAAAPATKPQGTVTAGYSDQDVADMLRKVMAGGDVPENIKKLLQAA